VGDDQTNLNAIVNDSHYHLFDQHQT